MGISIVENTKKRISLVRERMESQLEKILRKPTTQDLLKISMGFFLIPILIAAEKILLEYGTLDTLYAEITFFIEIYLLTIVAAIIYLFASKRFLKLNTSFIRLLASQIITFGLMLLIWNMNNIITKIVLLLPSGIGGPLSLILALPVALLNIGAILIPFSVLRAVVGDYKKAAKLWAIGQVAGIALTLVLLALYARMYSATMTQTVTYYTAGVEQDEQGTLLTMNRTVEGKFSEYCTTRLGNEWVMLEPDPERDDFYISEKSQIYSNDTRRFVNQGGDELAILGVTLVGGRYQDCDEDSQLLIFEKGAVCYFRTSDEDQEDYLKGRYRDITNDGIEFEFRSSTNNTRFLAVVNTTQCNSRYLSNSPLDRLFFR